MIYSRILKFVLLFILSLSSGNLISQIEPVVYISKTKNKTHELKIDGSYFIHSIYGKSPAKFIKTVGGFYAINDNVFQINLEFNSDYQKDSLKTLEIPIQFDGNTLIFGDDSKLIFEHQESNSQDLDGQWLFATKGPDEGQKRRGEANSRKTLKFLLDGRFQWIAYDNEGMQFKGTGGGSYTSQEGIYTENIEYFSKDNSRVGTSLEFNYEVKANDWHHKGKTSKGKPMYEIWGRRK